MKQSMTLMTMILLAGCATESTVTRNNSIQNGSSISVANTSSVGNAAVPDSSAPRGRFSLSSQSKTSPAPPAESADE